MPTDSGAMRTQRSAARHQGILLAALLVVPLVGCQGEPERRRGQPPPAPVEGAVPSAADCKTGDEMQHLTITLRSPEDAQVSLVSGVLIYPTDLVAIPGRGNDIPPETLSDVSEGTLADVFDVDGELKFIAGNVAAPFKTGTLLKVHLPRCEGAAVPAAEAFGCTVTRATGPTKNVLKGVTCTVAMN